MISVGFEIAGLDKLVERLGALAEDVPAKADEAAQGAAEDAKAAGDPLTPVRTGYLLSRNQTRMVGPGSAEFYNDCEYALPVCAGHHTRSGSWVPARDWMTPALFAGEESLARRLAEILAVV